MINKCPYCKKGYCIPDDIFDKHDDCKDAVCNTICDHCGGVLEVTAQLTIKEIRKAIKPLNDSKKGDK